ncbi:MAG: glutaminyl-peptide cyclotransferase [Rikenellaceae bacterium]
MNITLIILTIVAVSCNNNSEKSKIVIRTILPTTDMQIKAGDKVDFSITTKSEIDSAQLFIGGKYVATSKSGRFAYTLSKEESIGDKSFKIVAFYKGNSGERSSQFTVLPSFDPARSESIKIATLPHSRDSYTQGLEFYDGKLYESSGQYGESYVKIMEFPSMKTLKRVDLEDKYFAEGITILNDKLYMLTWKEQKAFVFDAKSLEKIGEFDYTGQGWGLTNDGEYLYMSDGSEYIYKVDPETFKKIGKIKVLTNKGVIYDINELEWINGKIYANVYGYDSLLVIDSDSGLVETILFCNNLLSSAKKNEDTDVFNGIAFDNRTQKLYVTGKNWPELYEIEGL